MFLRKVLRFLLFALLGLVALLLLFLVVSVGPVDRTPAASLPGYDSTLARIERLDHGVPPAGDTLRVGFARVNITPPAPMATAGYGSRQGQPYTDVHDSIYVRAMVVDNGVRRVAVVSADLLIIPPTVTAVLPEKLDGSGFSLDNTYMGATHSHNSLGHWGERAMTILYGAYEDTIVHFLAEAIAESVALAAEDLSPATLRYGALAAPGPVRNRLIRGGDEDAYLRVMEVHRADSVVGVMLSYAAHATCSSQKTMELSRDYPGALVDSLEAQGYDFAMFLAGAVGSHTTDSPGKDWTCMAWMAEQLTETVLAGRDSLRPMDDRTLAMVRVPLALSDPQIKVSTDLKVRAWLFRSVLGEYPAFLTALRIGDLVMLGAPCDFSGAFQAPLDSAARHKGLRAMATSFNGGYIGYITPVVHYDRDHYETQLMNWYAPGTGEYIQRCMEGLMSAVDDAR